MNKTEAAILNKTRLGHCVWPLQEGRVAIAGARAVLTAKRLEAQGLIKFRNTTQHNTRIGNKLDGSYKYGTVWEGVAEVK